VRPHDVAAITAEIARRRHDRIAWVMELSLDATRAMLEGGEPRRDMGRLLEPAWQGSLTRLWSGAVEAEPDRFLHRAAA
jgi:hypothetical protein